MGGCCGVGLVWGGFGVCLLVGFLAWGVWAGFLACREVGVLVVWVVDLVLVCFFFLSACWFCMLVLGLFFWRFVGVCRMGVGLGWACGFLLAIWVFLFLYVVFLFDYEFCLYVGLCFLSAVFWGLGGCYCF